MEEQNDIAAYVTDNSLRWIYVWNTECCVGWSALLLIMQCVILCFSWEAWSAEPACPGHTHTLWRHSWRLQCCNALFRTTYTVTSRSLWIRSKTKRKESPWEKVNPDSTMSVFSVCVIWSMVRHAFNLLVQVLIHLWEFSEKNRLFSPHFRLRTCTRLSTVVFKVRH